MVLVAIGVNIPLSAQAYVLIGNKLNGGVGNWYTGTYRYYWYDSSNSYASNINASIYKWNHTGSILITKINFMSTSYKPASVSDFYKTTEPNTGANGYTLFYVGSSTTPISPFSSNWDWCRIYLNTTYYDALSTNELKQGVICHEFGHVMGLYENNSNPSSIMCQSAYGRSVTSPQLDDLQGINSMY